MFFHKITWSHFHEKENKLNAKEIEQVNLDEEYNKSQFDSVCSLIYLLVVSASDNTKATNVSLLNCGVITSYLYFEKATCIKIYKEEMQNHLLFCQDPTSICTYNNPTTLVVSSWHFQWVSLSLSICFFASFAVAWNLSRIYQNFLRGELIFLVEYLWLS